jgi:hypothetical protein
MVLGDSTLESLKPSVNAPLRGCKSFCGVVKFFHILGCFVEVFLIRHTYVPTSVGWVCNLFDNSWVWVLDFLIKKSTVGLGLWKLKISNKKSGSIFFNVSEQ